MVDWNKPIQLRDGTPARLLGVLANHRRPRLVAAVRDDGVEVAHQVREDGYCDYDDATVVNVPIERTVYVNLYDMGPDCPPLASVHTTRELAEGVSGGSCEKVACVEVTYTEGEGLSNGS